MAPAPPKSKAGLGARLTAKVGPLPVWGWAALILGLYLAYTRFAPAKAATSPSDSTATPDSSGDSGSQVPASGQGSPADNLNGSLLDALRSNTSSLDALTSQLLYSSAYAAPSAFGDAPAAGTLPPDTSSPAPAAAPSAQPAAHPAAVGAPPAQHPSQTAAGVLRWGGVTFTSKAAFDAWARGHGSSSTAELSNHPQARAVYSTLK